MLNPSTSADFCEYSVIAENAPFHSTFSAKTLRFTLCICQKRRIPRLLWIRCILPKAHSFTPHFHRQRLVYLRAIAKNAKFYSAFSPKTLKTTRKRTVTKTALKLLCVLGDNIQPCFALSAKTWSDRKLRISGRIWRIFSKMLGVLRFVFVSDCMKQKKV